MSSAYCSGVHQEVGSFVLDYSDAFWQTPIGEEELRFFCATAIIQRKRKYMAFLRAAQGSAAAPTLWGRLAALLMRLTQSLFDPKVLRLMCYVDDPLAALLGSEEELMLKAATMVLVWSALGF